MCTSEVIKESDYKAEPTEGALSPGPQSTTPGNDEEAASEERMEAATSEDLIDASGKLSLRVEELREKVESLTRLVEEANHLSQERERVIDRLHQENQLLRQGELQQALLPVLRDSIRLFDDLKQTALTYASRNEVAPQDAAHDFNCLSEMVADILYRHGFDRYGANPGDSFNSKEHRALSAVPTSEQNKDRTIARTVRDGFRREANVIRLLEADVYRYVPDNPSQEDGDTSINPQPATLEKTS